MGACASVQDRTALERSAEIDRQIEEDSRRFRKECKILLLGAFFFNFFSISFFYFFFFLSFVPWLCLWVVWSGSSAGGEVGDWDAGCCRLVGLRHELVVRPDDLMNAALDDGL